MSARPLPPCSCASLVPISQQIPSHRRQNSLWCHAPEEMLTRRRSGGGGSGGDGRAGLHSAGPGSVSGTRWTMALLLLLLHLASRGTSAQPYKRTAQVEMMASGGQSRALQDDDSAVSTAYFTNLIGTYFRDWLLISNSSNAPANNQYPFYPGCGIFDQVNSRGMGCNFIQIQKAFMVRYWLDFESLTRTIRPALDEDGVLPTMLSVDLRPLPPRQVPEAISKKEMPTYYFCYKAILKMYAAAFNANNRKPMVWPFLEGWEEQKMHFVQARSSKGTRMESPIAISLLKGERMLVVIRGTMWLDEWENDFHYQWAREEWVHRLFPGKVHMGMITIFKMFYKTVVEEVRKFKPSEILVTGHSLGAGLAIYLGHLLQNSMQGDDDFPHHRVEVIGFGGPNPGDAAFVDSYASTVNARHILFVGEGAGDPSLERKYIMGDIVAQYTCGPYPACDSIGTGGPPGTTYAYARPRSQVPFLPGDMKNGRRWEAVSNLYGGPESHVPSFRRLIASHVCSYLCFTAAAVGDPEDHCYFSIDQNPRIPAEYLCDTSSIVLP